MKATIKLYGLVSLKGDDAENWVLARFFSELGLCGYKLIS